MPLKPNFTRVKEPRGFIKIIEFLIAILAFSTTAGYNSEFKVSLSFNCGEGTDSQTVLATFGYSFSKYKTSIGGVECTTNPPPLPAGANGEVGLPSSLKSSSEFFVFVGAISFLYCIGAMVYYVCFEDPAKYGPGGTGRDIKSFATVDFAVTVLLTLFWFCASTAWAAGLSKLKDKTDAGDFCQSLRDKGVIAPCSVTDKANYAGITISVLFGFLCCFLWGANVWFVFKETVWHKEPEATITAEQPESEIPRQEVPGKEAVP